MSIDDPFDLGDVKFVNPEIEIYNKIKTDYDPRLTKSQVLELYNIGINSINTPLEKQARLFHHLSKIFILQEYIRAKGREPNLFLYSKGAHSVILREIPPEGKSKTAMIYTEPTSSSELLSLQFRPIYKLSDDYENEIRLYQKIDPHHYYKSEVIEEYDEEGNLILSWEPPKDVEFKDFCNNVIVGENIGYGIIELMAGGESYEKKYLDRSAYMGRDTNGFTAQEHVIDVGREIFRGLLDLRRYDVFHRDLWMGNIVDGLDKTVQIIDLGLATDIPNSEPRDNRRYGGANDLISLGQIIYRLAIGRNFFKTSVNKSSWLVADEIKKFRNECYQTPELLEIRVKEMELNMFENKFEGIKKIIKACLTSTEPNPKNTSFAHDEHYHKIAELFNKHINPDLISGYRDLEYKPN
jgi:hypothetical protein